MNLRRQARRRLGSRTTRRANTNGKILAKQGGGGTGKGGRQRRSMCRRHPRPVKNLGWKVRAILATLH